METEIVDSVSLGHVKLPQLKLIETEWDVAEFRLEGDLEF